jgi:hypothetical protein
MRQNKAAAAAAASVSPAASCTARVPSAFFLPRDAISCHFTFRFVSLHYPSSGVFPAGEMPAICTFPTVIAVEIFIVSAAR